ncbi:hypothetical protein VNO77_23589 [Canavalia gladiata]|uniref:SANT domain-containing protein n=1 Tax=Canavalia gladiata TaxID=3824 RepID=A0AAN9L751_CANGL
MDLYFGLRLHSGASATLLTSPKYFNMRVDKDLLYNLSIRCQLPCYSNKSPRVGAKYQAKLPSLMSQFEYYYFENNWEKKVHDQLIHGCETEVRANGNTLVNVTELRENKNSKAHERKNKWKNNGIGSKSDTWSEIEEASFTLGLYIFEKDLKKVKIFVGSKTMGDILAFYYGKFYMSNRYWRWYQCKKNMNNKECFFGSKIFKGERQDKILSRLLPKVPEEIYNELLKVSSTFTARKISLENYVWTLKALVGCNFLVEAVGIDTEKDLTGFYADSVKFTNAISVGQKDFAWHTPSEIIRSLTGDFRLMKTQAKKLFWEAVWPRLVARGWHFSRHNGDTYAIASTKPPLFFIPGVKKFSKNLVKGTHYFDSISDILIKVALDPELIELETVEYNGNTNLEQKDSLDQQRHYCAKPPTPNSSSKIKRLLDGVRKGYAFEDGSYKNTVGTMCLDKGKTKGTKRASSSIVVKDNPSEKLVSNNQKTGRRDTNKMKSIQNMYTVADGKNIAAARPAPKKQKRLSGGTRAERNFNSASLSINPREKQEVASFRANNSKSIENVTSNSFVAPRMKRTKGSNSLLNPNCGENAVSKGTPSKTVADSPSQSITSSTIKTEVILTTNSFGTKDQHEKPLARTMIDLNLPALPDDDPHVATISETVNHSENQPEMNTRRRSTRIPIPSKRMLAFWETKDL